jgi:beta-lactamase regulating signal transducer with metallopeptidase domain
MTITDLGWVVVHSLWQGLFIAGLTALALGLVREPRAQARYIIACTSLALMAILPIAAALSRMSSVRMKMRAETMAVVEQVISFPTLIWWGSVVVPVLGALWAAGFVVCLARIGAEVRRARSLRQDGLGDAGSDVRAVIADLDTEDPAGVPTEVRSSSRAAVPMVLGWRRPLILLPDGTANRLRPNQLRAILAHELAHVRRGDYLANLLQMAAETLLFHHPGARWVSRVIRAEREYCCDDAAVRAGSDAAGYARALAALEDARTDCRLAVAAGSGTLLDRIQRIVGHPRQIMTPLGGAAVLVATSVLAAAILSISLLIPPSLPFAAEVRARSPLPSGQLPMNRMPAPDAASRPRMPSR